MANPAFLYPWTHNLRYQINVDADFRAEQRLKTSATCHWGDMRLGWGMWEYTARGQQLHITAPCIRARDMPEVFVDVVAIPSSHLCFRTFKCPPIPRLDDVPNMIPRVSCNAAAQGKIVGGCSPCAQGFSYRQEKAVVRARTGSAHDAGLPRSIGRLDANGRLMRCSFGPRVSMPQRRATMCRVTSSGRSGKRELSRTSSWRSVILLAVAEWDWINGIPAKCS